MALYIYRLLNALADAGTSTRGGQQGPNGRIGVDVKCCRRQHQVLATCIRHALQNWGPSDELPLSYWIDGAQSRRETTAPMQVTPELKRVLTRAKSLSEDCCRELPPLKAALRHAEQSEAFADILNEIHWCTSVFFNASARRKLELDSAVLKDFPWQAQLGYEEHFLLENAAEADWQQLMGELENWKQDHLCSAEHCGNMHVHNDPSYCLVGQVLRGLSFEELKVEHDHKFFLLSFDKDVVKYVRPLGAGAYGMVREVTWLGLNYAQKVFNHTGLRTLRTEADALVKMNHPHIVKVSAYSEDSLLMDLMWMDLDKFIRNRMKGGAKVQPFSLPATIDLMLQIADGVSYLHSQKMAHRDLKSSNILVKIMSTKCAVDHEFVVVKITDFGLSETKQASLQRPNVTHNVGTTRWMPPEMFGANMEGDHLEDALPMKADAYSFGIVCFEILSGEKPFKDVPVVDLYSKLTAPIPLRPRLPSNCPASLASLVSACWNADRRERPAFTDVCRVLRYLKGLQLLSEVHESECSPIDRVWPFGRLTPKVQKQGPWVAPILDLSPELFWRSSGPVGDISAFKVNFGDTEKLELRGFAFSVGEELLRDERTVGGDGVSSDSIRFDHPDEYLVQVEGSYSQPGNVPSRVSSLSFITSKQKHGPYGTIDGPTTSFCSDPGRVVDFHWSTDGSHICALGVSVIIPGDIVGCLRNFLEEDQSA